MSKEQLEEIKHELYILHNCTETDEAIKDFIFNHLKTEWLIEQAERVIDYDNKLISIEDNKQYVSELLEQNKRYREAIMKAKKELLNINGEKETRPFTVYGILNEALEGEEIE